MEYQQQFDVIVVGGGHAGTEACLAAARMGCRTLLLTHSVDTLGQMSCNPAIGGIGKSHLVKEVDALGGAMALATDRAGIQFRVLNSRKGPAVRATRAQADRVLYRNAIREILEAQPNLAIFQQPVDDLLIENGRVAGAITQMGLTFRAPTVVLTTGTFLGGKLHIGMQNSLGGRAGDPPSIALAQRLRELPFRVERLKTGTPPRIDARSVDFSGLEEQWGDSPEPVMSFLGSAQDHPPQRCCWVTYTNDKTHEIIRGELHGMQNTMTNRRSRCSQLILRTTSWGRASRWHVTEDACSCSRRDQSSMSFVTLALTTPTHWKSDCWPLHCTTAVNDTSRF